MKFKMLFMAAAALLTVSCGKTDKAAETGDSVKDTIVAEAPVDSNQVDTTTAEAAPETPAKAEVAPETPAKAEAETKNNELDGEVDKIISQINKHITTIKDLKDNGIPSGSATAFRAIENLPDYDKKLKKIKSKLSPEQKARINAAEKKLQKLIDSWE
ncbi:MAG: hypothetical protein K2N05_11550 [Muribaculaceae bacterium]|nr:hypothetical protein [Muribaculaceae bacterium]